MQHPRLVWGWGDYKEPSGDNRGNLNMDGMLNNITSLLLFFGVIFYCGYVGEYVQVRHAEIVKGM